MSDTDRIVDALRVFQSEDALAAFSVDAETDPVPKIWLNWVGSLRYDLQKFIDDHQNVYEIESTENRERYFFLNDELRPGSGLIRVFGGKSQGPGGTVTCLLTSEDGEDNYLVAAGHVLTDFWRDLDGHGSIYRYRKGFPSTGSSRFLGKALYYPEPWPKAIPKGVKPSKESPRFILDVGVVKLEVDPEVVDLKQRTTCFGGFGETCITTAVRKRVMKCGSQEVYWTEAKISKLNAEVTILGPDGSQYLFKDQIILRDLRNPSKFKYPTNPKGTPFAVPGDSGTIVVDEATRQPIGMLIAGSVLDGRYVVTPFEKIEEFFTKLGLIRMRA